MSHVDAIDAPALLPAQRRWGAIVVAIVSLVVVIRLALLALPWPTPSDPRGYLEDERHNAPQIDVYRAGGTKVDPALVMPPTYHALVAAIAKATGVEGLTAYRIISTVLSLPAIWLAYLLLAQLPPPIRALRTLQVFFLPVLFPYLFMVYTDAFSMTLLLLSLWFAQRRSFTAAGLAAIASMAVRQNNIIWLAFVMASIYFQHFGPRITFDAVLRCCRACWSFLLGMAAFVAFYLLNGGVAMGDKSMHPSFQFHTENIFTALFVCGVLFVPLHLGNLKQAFAWTKRRPWILAVLALGYVLLRLTFETDHPYHLAMQHMLVNRVTTSVTRSALWEVMFYLVIAGTVLSLCVTPLRHRWQLILYPASALFLAPSWMIHARYYMIPFTLFLLMRSPSTPRREALTVVVLAAWSAATVLIFKFYI